MSEQMKDSFKWNKKEYVFIAADNVYELFDPKKYGLVPESPHSACWKGFIICFSVRNDQLYIDRLDIKCKDDQYPLINGVNARRNLIYKKFFHSYNKLRMPVKYTGKITIGRKLDEYYKEREFIGPYAYNQTYELEFQKGVLISAIDTTGTYQGF